MQEKQAGEIRAVIYQEGDVWVAQCLEHDIRAQAKDLDTLNSRIRVALALECAESMKRNGEAFKGIDPAPKYFHELFDKSAGVFSPEGPKTVGCDGSEVELEMRLAA